MAEVAVSVVNIERLESLPERYLVELTKGMRAVTPSLRASAALIR